MSKLKIDPATLGEFRKAHEELTADLELLARMTKHYPVVCMIAGRRWVFESKQDILDLIAQISDALRAFDQAA